MNHTWSIANLGVAVELAGIRLIGGLWQPLSVTPDISYQSTSNSSPETGGNVVAGAVGQGQVQEVGDGGQLFGGLTVGRASPVEVGRAPDEVSALLALVAVGVHRVVGRDYYGEAQRTAQSFGYQLTVVVAALRWVTLCLW